MSQLRKHLEDQKAWHRAAKYQGDLASDILRAPQAKVVDYASRNTPRPISIFKIIAALGTLTAAAAAVAIVLWLGHPAVQNHLAVRVPPSPDDVPFVLNTTVSMPDNVTTVPSDVGSLVPDYQSMSIDNISSIPNVSDFSSDDESSQTSNSKEST